HPVVELNLSDPIDLGGEFMRWEIATAIAGVVLGINPFDEPNVTESKNNTVAVLGELAAAGRLPELAAKAVDGALQIWVDDALPAAFNDDAVKLVAGQMQRLTSSGYIGIHAYLATTPERTAALTSLRLLLRNTTRRATTVGYGPRFLHSTGQLHKGGAPIGWFLQLVSSHPADLAIPGKSFSFGQLVDAQSLGDARSLVDHGLPVLRIHLGANPDVGLAAVESLFRRALAT
ncbi:MAG: transaldolase, partial [Chloroflexota bacterium]